MSAAERSVRVHAVHCVLTSIAKPQRSVITCNHVGLHLHVIVFITSTDARPPHARATEPYPAPTWQAIPCMKNTLVYMFNECLAFTQMLVLLEGLRGRPRTPVPAPYER